MEASMPTEETSLAGDGPGSRRHVARQLAEQAEACAALGSPLYAALLAKAAADAAAGGLVWTILGRHVRPGRGDAIALRLMAAVHRLVLTGQAPGLARWYPSVGGRADPEPAWGAFRAVLQARSEELAQAVGRPCQTNEVGRCAPLAGGFLAIAAITRLPLRLLEVGASAGLSLRWDHYRYGDGRVEWGDPASPVDLRGFWTASPPHLRAAVSVTDRRGCDRRPVDPTSDEGRLDLLASVWADQKQRVRRLQAACALAADVPVTIDEGTLVDWVPARLAEPAHGSAIVVYHSVVEEYLAADERRMFHHHLAEAGQRATPAAPLAWLRLEPASRLRGHALTLTTWPGGEQRRIAVSRAHGQQVRWTEPAAP
jgi:hypothetical protein